MNNYIQKVKGVFSGSALRSILRWSKPAHVAVFAVSGFAVLGSLMSLGVTLVTKGLIDGATSGSARALWLYGGALAALIAAERLLSVWSAHIRMKADAKLQMHMQALVTDAIMGKQYAALKGYHSGELVNRVFSDCAVVKNGVMNLLPSFLRMAVSFIGAAVILISWDWRLVPVMIVASLLGAGVSLVFREPMKARHKRMQAAEDALHASTQETLESIRLVKASVSEQRAMSAMEERRERLSSEQIRNGKLSILMNNSMGIMFDISWLVCNLWGCVKIYQGTFTYGSLAAMIQLVGRIQGPIANAVSLISQIYGVTASAERLQDVIGLPDEEQGVTLDHFDEIRLEQMSFQYADGSEDVLIDVNTAIRRGDFVAVTGLSGGGKTSLFQLLLGIYQPTGGRVVFSDGEREVTACRGTRGLFAYVPQGNTLMSGTLRENLTMFTDAASEAEIAAAVHAACLDDIVTEIGMYAKLGERGVGLSEGQAQRVAIARALLSKAPILLLDESTSALDEETEARLLRNIDAMRDKTVIIVTHRRAALAICDYTLHIAGGRMTRIEESSPIT
ncbi:MAG: ABC transporter ATP-binding protein [Clostridia bacterium]|nr:ABC transporter ATP-binding protein [Clostridia bacterium]